MRGPAHQARLGKFLDCAQQRRRAVGLLWIGRDDLEIPAFFLCTGSTKRKQSVLCAAAGVGSTECGADASVLFDERDASLEVVGAEKYVVEHGWHQIN